MPISSPGDKARVPDRRFGCPVCAPAGREAGFSLLEVLISIAILGLALAISLPSMAALRERQQVRHAFAGVNAWILDQRMEARLAGVLGDYPEGAIPVAPPRMPDGWSAEWLTPWRLYPSGSCMQGEIRIRSARGRVWERTVAPPDCRAVFETAN